MIDLLILVLALIGASALWTFYLADKFPQYKDKWFDKALKWPWTTIATWMNS